MLRTLLIVPVLCSTLAMVGCGSRGAFDTVPVHGTVTFEGKPVTEGTIDLVPVPGTGSEMAGKPGAASIQEDGTYQAGTYATTDGIVPGKKRVRFSAPLPADTRDAAKVPPSPYAGLQIEPSEINVQAGDNKIDFVLKKKSK